MSANGVIAIVISLSRSHRYFLTFSKVFLVRKYIFRNLDTSASILRAILADKCHLKRKWDGNGTEEKKCFKALSPFN